MSLNRRFFTSGSWYCGRHMVSSRSPQLCNEEEKKKVETFHNFDYKLIKTKKKIFLEDLPTLSNKLL